MARDAGVHRLVLSHFSERYRDTAALGAEAAEVFPGAVLAHNLTVVDAPD